MAGSWRGKDEGGHWSSFVATMTRQGSTNAPMDELGYPASPPRVETNESAMDMDDVVIKAVQERPPSSSRNQRDARRQLPEKHRSRSRPKEIDLKPVPPAVYASKSKLNRHSANESLPVKKSRSTEMSLQGKMSTAKMVARISALEKENAELRGALQAAGGAKNNFPWFYPVAHHDIETDIPSERFKTVRTAYFAWLTALAGYLLNWFIITLLFASDGNKGFMDWLLACFIAIIGIPVSWMFWYKNLYRSQITDRFYPYSQFFFHGSVHVVWCIWTIVSPPVWLGNSTAGLLNFQNVDKLDDSYRVFMLVANIVNLALWGLSLLATLAAFAFANSTFRNCPQAKVDEANGHLMLRIFEHMFSAKEPVSDIIDAPACKV